MPLWLTLLGMGLAVGVTTLYVWSKVESADIAQRTSLARTRAEALQEDRSRLRAAVVMGTKPGTIKHIARTRLMMFPASEEGADASQG